MVEKKKLLMVNPNQFGYVAGLPYYCKYLAPYFEIDFLCFDQGFKKIDEKGTNIYYQVYNRNKIIRICYYIYFALKLSHTKKYDVLFTTNFKFVFILGIFFRCKITILDIRSGDLSDNLFINRYKNLCITLTSLFFDKITVVSLGLAKLLNLSFRKTFIIPLGADVIDNSSKIYNKLNLIYVGSLCNRKVEITIEGLNLFNKKFNNVIPLHYDIIGFGKVEDELKIANVIKNNHLEKIVQFHGRKNHSELPFYFKNATVGVCFIPQTSYYNIQPATKLFEYALSGLINIATSTSENKIFITQENGVLCNDNVQSFYEALEKVFNRASSFNEHKIRDSLSNYNWKIITTELLLPVLNETILISKG